MTDEIKDIDDVSLRSSSDSDTPTHIVIKPARYRGVYAQAPWILVAGLRSPETHTGAWGNDTECRGFWEERRSEGPTFERQVGNYTKEGYAAAGDDPNQLVVEMFQHYDN